jgi:hypothetical protein
VLSFSPCNASCIQDKLNKLKTHIIADMQKQGIYANILVAQGDTVLLELSEGYQNKEEKRKLKNVSGNINLSIAFSEGCILSTTRDLWKW